ncbi:hypothetical protein ACQY0O_001314 [Thecaphora frezii]
MGSDDRRRSRSDDRAGDHDPRSTGRVDAKDSADANDAHQNVQNIPDDAGGNGARKRKKRFKYMLESESGGNGEGRSGDAEDTDRDASGADCDARKESRKKVKKACIFCKRSHMPCEEARPCRRCIKRGIPGLCRDAEPLNGNGKQSASSKNTDSQKTGSGKASSGTSSSTPESNNSPADHFVIPGASARDPDFKSAMSISLLLSPADVSTTRMSQAPVYAETAAVAVSLPQNGVDPSARAQDAESARDGQSPVKKPAAYTPGYAQAQARAWDQNMDYQSQQELMRLLEAGPSAVDLNDAFGDKPTSLLNYPNMIGLPVGDPLMMPSATNSPSPVPNGDVPDDRGRDPAYHVGNASSLVRSGQNEMFPRPKHILQEEHATTAELRGVKSYSYTYGYAKLARWMQTRFSRESCEAVDRCLAQIRPKFLAISRSLSERELLGVEEAFVRLVHHYQANVLDFVPLPTFVTRRTGEIYAANEHAARFFQLPRSLFEGGQISHFQTAPEDETVKLWQIYAKECMGVLKDPPVAISKIEVDRSLLLFNRPGFDPHTGELLGDGSGLCEDGSPAVIRKRCIVSFEAKISQHGLPVMLICQFIELPDEA